MNNKKLREKKDEVQSNRMALYMTITFIVIMLLMYLYRKIESIVGLENFQPTMWILIGLSGALLLWGLYRLFTGKGKDTSSMLVQPIVQVVLSLCAVVMFYAISYFYIDAIKFLYFLLPAVCALYIILIIYGTEFFAVSFFLLSSASALFVYYRAGSSSMLEPYIALLAGILVLYAVVFAILTFMAQKNKGVLRLFGKSIPVLSQKGGSLTYYLSALVVLAVGVAYFTSPISAAYYGFFAVGITLVICAAFYTYKLMYNE